ncbi:RidA family protein [Aquibium sp. A9E412]|uniref:RidA family protein n=1 Tax=Aquibium sp. A9E412 TaxID=2976767 RepID=UPI0025AF7B12|nr:RidA family protein [Aquibium sp. A9E412]MDN2564597.1 RidA family protein [Aquibium sp. A9E412]
MNTPLAPSTIHPPFGRYSHGIARPAGTLIVTSGQLGVRQDGTVPDTVAGQAGLCLDAIAAILAEAGAGKADIVRLNAYVTERAHMQDYMAVRDAFLRDLAVKPASTLMIVGGFTRPEFLVEVEATAIL